MLEVGFESGCIKVISNDFESNSQKITESVRELAQSVWLGDESGASSDNFEKYYGLNKKETQIFVDKGNMPDSFVNRYLTKELKNCYWWFLKKLPNVLWHEKKPDTSEDLAKAILKKQIYEVECSICKKHYFMDETSICCVRRRLCSGAQCLSTTLKDKKCEYRNLCTVNNESHTLQLLNTQLMRVEELTNPLSYYGGGENSGLTISYIADIHLLHHLSDDELSMDELIRRYVRNLYDSMSETGIILFAGDISSRADVTMLFYKAFVKYEDYLYYKKKKRILLGLQHELSIAKEKEADCKKRIKYLEKYIVLLKNGFSKYFDFKAITTYKKSFHKDDSWATTIACYKNIPVHEREMKKFSNKFDEELDFLASKLDQLDDLQDYYEEVLEENAELIQKASELENHYGKAANLLSVHDICSNKHRLLSETHDIFVVLGNHEYIGFESVTDAISFYKKEFGKLGIKLLHNEYSTIEEDEKKYVIYGGTGFAKYNEMYNANSLVCCDNFTREKEIAETEQFEKGYYEAKKIAKDEEACFICMSHYPIHDCMEKCDPDTIYFYGHNHQNFYCRNEKETVYADNQIGYKNPGVFFKTVSTGFEVNPYYALGDGMYETTIRDYLQFYKYIGEYVGEGTILYQRCQDDKATMYVIKRKGFYGFFIVNNNSGISKGISIVNGGITKKITKSTDLQWLFDNFEVVLLKYIQIMLPLRRAQEKISAEVKKLGLSGAIHGCIVDVDYYHHIMLNPMDGSITFYYSPFFGLVSTLSSFDEMISSMREHDVGLFASKRDYEMLQSQFNDMKEDTSVILNRVNESYLLEDANNATLHHNSKEQFVSRSDGMYGLSRRINPLQRLFSGHVLREFDISLAETQPVIAPKIKTVKTKAAIDAVAGTTKKE